MFVGVASDTFFTEARDGSRRGDHAFVSLLYRLLHGLQKSANKSGKANKNV